MARPLSAPRSNARKCAPMQARHQAYAGCRRAAGGAGFSVAATPDEVIWWAPMTDRSAVEAALGDRGLLRLEPAWVPRAFMHPGRRLRLHPDDLYAYGARRGGINERWFSSTTNADNGPGTPADEGLSYVRANGSRFLLKEAVEQAGDLLLGKEAIARDKGWNLLCKFFDNMGPIPHHMHQDDAAAARVGRRGKPEAYYFPPQYNPTDNN